MTTKKFFKYLLDGDKSEPLNEYGYRGHIVDSEKKILFLGCSVTYGYGVKNEETFAYQTAKLMGAEWSALNFGVPGSGPDIQASTAAWALNNFKIDKICWLMSHPMRTQLILESGGNLKFGINSSPDTFTKYKDQREIERFTENHIYFEKNNLYKVTQHLYTLFSLIKQKNIDCYVMSWEALEYDNTLQELRDEFGFKKIGLIRRIDVASDGMHPGPQSHLKFATVFSEIMKNEK